MAYTTVDKVKSMFRGIKIEADTGNEDMNTAVTTEDVNEFILEADAEINARLAPYYVLPIAGTESLVILGQISKYKVSHVIKTILEAKSEFSDKEQEVQTNLELKANKLLKMITPRYITGDDAWTEPEMPLPDAELIPRSPKGDSVFSSSRNVATIKKGGDNW